MLFKKFMITFLILLNMGIYFQISQVVTPIKRVGTVEEATVKQATVLKQIFNMSQDTAQSFVRVSNWTGGKYSPYLIATISWTESRFNTHAISPKGYKGLMQTPTMSGYKEVDILHGVKVLDEKMRTNNNNLRVALAAYKGGKDIPAAQKQANEVLEKYVKVKALAMDLERKYEQKQKYLVSSNTTNIVEKQRSRSL